MFSNIVLLTILLMTKDMFDNPNQASATKCKVECLAGKDRTLVISDNGSGFEDKHKLEKSYDAANSFGANKGHEYNYGQGEKFSALMLANTSLKAAQFSDTRRGVVMLSRSMQKGESGDTEYQKSPILRPVVEWKLVEREPGSGTLTWESQAEDAEACCLTLMAFPTPMACQQQMARTYVSTLYPARLSVPCTPPCLLGPAPRPAILSIQNRGRRHALLRPRPRRPH